MMTYMAQPRHLWNNQVLSKFFPSAEYTNKFSRQYSKWSFSMYFMTSTLFSSFPPPVLSPLSATQSIQSATQSPSLLTTPLPFFSHSPYFSSLYPKPAPDNRSKYDSWITSLIHLFFHHLHPCLSTIQSKSYLPTKWLPCLATISLPLSTILSMKTASKRNEWGSLVKADSFFIFPCFPKTWTETNVLIVIVCSSLRLRKLVYQK